MILLKFRVVELNRLAVTDAAVRAIRHYTLVCSGELTSRKQEISKLHWDTERMSRGAVLSRFQVVMMVQVQHRNVNSARGTRTGIKVCGTVATGRRHEARDDSARAQVSCK